MMRGLAQLMEPNAPTRTARPSDEDLLRRIAVVRDRAAFEELAQRFGKPAYNLALHLCSNAGMAEDAVQDAMVEVWLHAGRFDPARGQMRSWLMRIVANKTFSLRTRDGKQRKREMNKSAGTALEAPDLARESFEDSEMKSVLRQMLGNLPVADRQIVSLYFGAELSQDEIARTMGISQRTVSHRLKQAIEQLRRGLTSVGLATAVPLSDQSTLGHRLLDLEATPASLHAGILRSLGSAPRKSTRAGAVGRPWMPWLTGAVLLVGAAGCGWWAFKRSAIQPEPTGAAKAAPVASGAGERTADEEKPQEWTWAFDGPKEAKDFEVIGGAWSWIPEGGKDRPGVMRVSDSVQVAVSADLSDGCYLLAFDIANVSTHGMSAGAFWEQEGPAVTVSNLSNSPRPANPVWLPVDVYITGEYRIAMMRDEVRHIVFARRQPGARLAISLVGSLLVDNISMRHITDNEIPDIQPYRTLVDGIPAAERDGTVKRLLGEGKARQHLQVVFPPKAELRNE